MYRYLVALVAIVALLTPACGRELLTGRDASIPLPAHPTWSWGKRSVVSRYATWTGSGNLDLHLQVQRAIEGALARKGWKQAKHVSRANVVVSYQIRPGLAENQFSTSDVPTPAGSFLIIIHERASGRVAWLGLYKKETWESAGGHGAIQRVVDQLLDELK